jgi:23S rRNA (guanosine2251-2'-O)-methyltransferase
MESENSYIAGMRSVMEAIESGKKIEKVLFRQGLEGEQFRILIEKLKTSSVPFQFVPVEKLNSYIRGHHQGVIAIISRIDYVSVEQIIEKAKNRDTLPLVILLDGVSDVRNFGAVARSAECSGAAGIILPAKGGAAVNADAVKSSAGALLRIPVAKVQNLRVAIYLLKESGFVIVGADEKADKLIYDIDFKKPVAIVMGSEERGISDSVTTLLDDRGKIPLHGEIGSLNVSVAAAVVMFEAVRQRSV